MEGKGGNALSPAFSVDEEAGDAPVWKLAQSLLVSLLASYVREFRDGAELAPPDRVRAVEDERGMRPTFPH